MNTEAPKSNIRPAVKVTSADSGATIELSGAWNTTGLEHVDDALGRVDLPDRGAILVDASSIQSLDTGGALRIRELLTKLEDSEATIEFRGLSPKYQQLLGFVWTRVETVGVIAEPKYQTFMERIGEEVWSRSQEGASFLAFIGEASVTAARSLIAPKRIRWRSILGIIQNAGVQAIPIVGLLSFLLGVVIAYQGGLQLKLYGANIFIVELVTVTTVRELGPLITAIIIAGRTGSAFTAEIGTMKVTEEIDAMRTLGIGPMDVLVLPKVLGLMIVMPLLTLLSCFLGVLGGMVMADLVLDVDMLDFLRRIPEALSFSGFLVGIGKAPVFAAIVALVGCFQGTRVSGGAEGVGRQTTISVVQAIFLVIIADAGFSILFSFMGV